MSRVHESQQEVREPIEIGQSSQVARVSKEMARDHQRSTCQRSFCASLLQARGDCQHHLLLRLSCDAVSRDAVVSEVRTSLKLLAGSAVLRG